MSLRSIPAGEFKSKCLKIMDMVKETHRPIIITKYGKPVAKLTPINEESPKSLFGAMKGSVAVIEDITKPVDEEWGAEK
jgi:prevent-host-death family protein